MRRILTVLLLLLPAFLFGAAPAAAVTPQEVVLEDTAGVLDAATLLPALEGVDFREPTTVAVYTYNGTADANLNEEVLRYARAEHPEWISADGQKWADGLFIFALDPLGRWTGTYFGEDRKIPLDEQEEIRGEISGLFREAQWTDGTIAAVEEAADRINQPWYASDEVVGGAVAGCIALLAGGGIGTAVRRRRLTRNRDLLKTADAAYSSVSFDLEVTELNARTIPTGSTYGSRVLEQYRTFMTRYDKATDLSNRVRALTDKDLKKRSSERLIQDYADAAVELDGLDDVIADTNALLNKAPGWERGWDRQVEQFRDDLGRLDELLNADAAQKSLSTGPALLAFRTRALHDLDRWAAEISDNTTSAETALDRLRDARREFSELLKNHADLVIMARTKNHRERVLMDKAMEKATARPRPRTGYRPGIVDTVYPSSGYYSVGTFGAGLTAGTSAVRSARSSSSRTGYGQSGGSFSGAGSSGRF